MKQKVHCKNLFGNEFENKLKECENTGFVDICRSVLKRIRDGEVREVSKVEIDYLLKKLH